MRGALTLPIALQREDPQRTLVLPQASAAEEYRSRALRVCGAPDLLRLVRAMLPGDAAEPLTRNQTADVTGLRLASCDNPMARPMRSGARWTTTTSPGRQSLKLGTQVPGQSFGTRGSCLD